MMCKYQIIFDQSCPDTYFSIFADYTFQKTTNILSISENVEPGSVSLFPSEIIFSSSANLSVKFDASYINDFDHQNKWKITFTPRPPPKKIQINLDTKTPYFLLWIDSMQSEEMMTICSGDGLEMEMEVRRANEDLSYIKFFNSTDMLGYVSSLNLEPGMQEFESFFSNHCFTIFQWYKPDGIGNKSFVLFKLLLDNQIIEINGNVKFESAANESHKITILSSNNPSSKNLQSVCISKFEATTPEAKYIFKNGFTGSPMLMLNGSVAEKYANFVFLTPALDIYIPPMAEMNVFCAAKCRSFFSNNN
uniref:Uncharacterized protein n=1 Tax=Panagrolaimus sp. ES5 TaxID=591445 RepID=A0AC34FUA2_9BILA